MVAHNAKFDIGFLSAAMNKYNLGPEEEILEENINIDVDGEEIVEEGEEADDKQA